MNSYGSKFFPLLTATVKDAGKMKITELLPMKLYPFTLRQNLTVEKKDAFAKKKKVAYHLSEHATAVQRLLNVVQTSWMFLQR